MHELSIAYSLVQLTSKAAQEAGIRSVQAVHLKLGELSGVVEEALLFSYDIAAQGTLLAGSKLIIERIPVIVNCPSCGEVKLPTIQRFRCPICQTPTADLVHGRELEVSSLEYEEEEVMEADVGETAVSPLLHLVN